MASSNPASALPLWDVLDGTVVTTRGSLCGVAEAVGLAPTSTTSEAWAHIAQGLYQGLRQLGDHVYVQTLYSRGRLPDRELERLMRAGAGAADGELSSVLAYQREKRLEFLRQRELRSWRTYIAWGTGKGLSGSEFAQVSRKTHERQVRLLAAVERQVRAACQGAQLQLRPLDDLEIVALFRQWLDPFEHRRAAALRRELPLQDEGALRAEPNLRALSIREQLLPGNVVWDADWVRVGRTYFRVLAAKQLPASTAIGTFDRPRESSPVPLAELDFDFRLVVHTQMPSQNAARRSFDQRRRFAFSLAQRGAGEMSDARADVAEESMEVLARQLAKEEKLVKTGLQAVVWAPSVRELDERAHALADALGKLQFEVYEESWAHDRELYKTLPGLGLGTFDRWRLVTAPVAADLLPVASYPLGDPDPSLVFEDAATRQPFGWALREKARANDNFLILGASGSGKSVFINMLLAYGILTGPAKGRVLAIDYAGPTKSSFRVAAEVFGGRYIPISGDGKKINPWPTKTSACTADGSLRPEELAYLTALTNLLTENVDGGREQALSTGLIQSSIQRLYERWQSTEPPLYTDFLRALESCPVDARDEQKRREDLVKLTKKFLAGPEGGLLNHRTTAETGGEFLIYDLYGLQAYEPRVKSAVALVVTHQVRSTAFDGRPHIKKYIAFEEAAQLLSVGMQSTIQELFATARAHGTSVVTITQEYLAYTRSGIDGVVNLNTTTKVFLSHAKAQNAIEPIIHDFELNEQEAAVLKSLKSEPGKYSELMIRTTSRDPLGNAQPVTAKVLLQLSPFDYQVVNSTADDRGKQIALRARHPELSLAQVLDFLAYGRAA